MASDIKTKIIELPPVAGSVVHSLRSLGYSFNSAVADLIDNSISANAAAIDIRILIKEQKPVVFIIDDGAGMTDAELQTNLTIGSSNPNDEREERDLGRFGMGLKTASFSQAMNLLCISKKNGQIAGIEWDLEHVAAQNKWEARFFPGSICEILLAEENIDFKPTSGTLIRWTRCDRIMPGVESPEVMASLLGEICESLADYLGLIYHKFWARPGQRFEISINKKPIKPKDPFCQAPSAEGLTSSLIHDEPLRLNYADIPFKAYVLPHPTKIKSREKARNVSIDGDFFGAQGLYIYRADRLLAWGDWLRIIKKSESHKLGRCEINFPNSLDSLWGLDIMKSRVSLPHSVRIQLGAKIEKLGFRSRSVFTNAATVKNPFKSPIWTRRIDRESRRIDYKIDKAHPIIETLLSKLSVKEAKQNLDTLILLLEESIPVKMIANDIGSDYSMSSDRDSITESDKQLIDHLLDQGVSGDMILSLFERDDAYALRNKAEISDYISEQERQ